MHIECDNIAAIMQDFPIQANILETGIGTINTVYSLTKYLENNKKPDLIVNTGCAGAHSDKLQIGDVVAITHCVFASNIIIDEKGNSHYYGIRTNNTENNIYIRHTNIIEDEISYNNSFNVFYGGIASSDIWHQNIKYIEFWNSYFNTFVEDMEASSIAEIAARNGIKFIAFKDVSNSIYLPSDFEPFDHIEPQNAGENSAKIALQYLEKKYEFNEQSMSI